MTILDTAGAEEFHSIRDLNMRHAHGALVVFSVTDRESFYEVDNFHKEFLLVHDKTLDHGFPCLLVATKADLVSSRKVTETEAKEKAALFKMEYIETSAKLAQNVEAAFHEVVRVVRKYEDQHANATNSQKKPRFCILL